MQSYCWHIRAWACALSFSVLIGKGFQRCLNAEMSKHTVPFGSNPRPNTNQAWTDGLTRHYQRTAKEINKGFSRSCQMAVDKYTCLLYWDSHCLPVTHSWCLSTFVVLVPCSNFFFLLLMRAGPMYCQVILRIQYILFIILFNIYIFTGDIFKLGWIVKRSCICDTDWLQQELGIQRALRATVPNS